MIMEKHFGILWLAGLVLVIALACQKDEGKSIPKPCLERALFGNPQTSPYVLPFPVGKKYVLSQSYCNPGGGHSGQLAYDFALQIGDTVTAARAGIVKEVREDLPDTGSSADPGTHNHIFILHSDGSVGFYAHLQQDGVLVEVGEAVERGQWIARSGNSGNTGGFPHLHFGVYESWPAEEGFDLPIVFGNALGPIDDRGGLIADQWYEALIY